MKKQQIKQKNDCLVFLEFFDERYFRKKLIHLDYM